MSDIVSLVDAHEILISEYELLERRLTSKTHEVKRLRGEVRELRAQLKQAIEEVDELQGILSKAWVGQ